MTLCGLIDRLRAFGRRLSDALEARPVRAAADLERENETLAAEARAATDRATRASREAGRAAAKAGGSLRRVDRVILEGAEEMGRLFGPDSER
jgi:hypothetical protein